MRVTLVVTFWGAWHSSTFADACVPSLLSPGNLPALASQIETRLSIYTTSRDMAEVERSPGFQALGKHVAIEFRPIDGIDVQDHLAAHARFWHLEMDRARDDDMVVFIQPDAVFADGTLRRLAQLLSDGKRCIFLPQLLRVVDSTFLPLIRGMRKDGLLALDADSLVRMALRHLHPWSAAQIKTSPYFTRHPELVLWPVRKGALLGHCLASHPFAIAPRLFAVRDLKVLDFGRHADKVHFVADSREMFYASLARLDSDFGWFSAARRADPVQVGRWWTSFDSAANDAVATRPFLIRSRPVAPARLARAKQAGRLFVDRARAAREAYKIWRIALDFGCVRAAELIATALSTGLLWRSLGRAATDRRFAVLIPDDAALSAFDGSAAAIERVIRACVQPIAQQVQTETRQGAVYTDFCVVYRVRELKVKETDDNPLRNAAEKCGRLTRA